MLEREIESESDNSDDEFVRGLAARDWGDPDGESDCEDPEAHREHVIRGDFAPLTAVDSDDDVAALATVGAGTFAANAIGDDAECLNDFV